MKLNFGVVAAPTRLTGLEPATFAVTERHSNQLSYSLMNQAVGISALVM